MRTTIDTAGRVVIPKSLRDEVGLRPGYVEVAVEGNGIKIEVIADNELDEKGGRLVIPASGASIDDSVVSELRHGDQR